MIKTRLNNKVAFTAIALARQDYTAKIAEQVELRRGERRIRLRCEDREATRIVRTGEVDLRPENANNSKPEPDDVQRVI